MKKINKRKILIIIASIVTVLAIILGACVIYLSDYYHANENEIPVFDNNENISVSILENGNVVFEPQNASVGLIFYPGGKVEHNAYQPLMAALAREGILCILIKMPFNLAVFDINAARLNGILIRMHKIPSRARAAISG